MSTPTPSSAQQQQADLQPLLNGPAHPPPPGVQSNFVDPPTLDGVILANKIICMVVGGVAVLIRLYTRVMLIKSINLEDYVVALAWVGQIGFFVPSIYVPKFHGGRHIWDIQLKDFIQLLYWINVSGILYGIIILFIKLAILLQFIGIFVPNRTTNIRLFVAIHTIMWTTFLFYFVDTFFEIFMCNPREKIWNPLMEEGHCFNASALYMATGIFNVVSDFSILVLPMVPIWSLQIPYKKKIMISALFAVGVCACITSIIRTYYAFKVVNSPDVSYNVIQMGLWTWAEITAGLLIACLPTMPKFFQYFGTKVCESMKFNSSTVRSWPFSRRGEPYLPRVSKSSRGSLGSKRPRVRTRHVSNEDFVTWTDVPDDQVLCASQIIALYDTEAEKAEARVRERDYGVYEGPATRRDDLESRRFDRP